MAGVSYEQHGLLTFTDLVRSLTNGMRSYGFDISNVDGVVSNNPLVATNKILFRASPQMDGAASVGNQPWVFGIEWSEEGQWIDFYASAPGQVLDSTGDFTFANKKVTDDNVWKAGKLVKEGLHSTEDGIVRSLSFENWQIPNSDTQANPMSFRITMTDHGFAFYIWVESYDSSGQKFFWTVIQRMVDFDGVPVLTGKAPLFCLFANTGFPGDEDSIDDDYGTNPDSIHKFVVREEDVNAPTFPTSAVEDRADSARIINVAQQVSMRENNSVVLYFPNNLSTQRFAYPHQLDLLGVISADVVSQSSDLIVGTFDEDTSRTYRGMNADQINNKGARIMFWTSGGTLDN